MKRHSFFQTQAVRSLIIMALRGVSLVTKFVLTLFIARFMGFETLGLYGLIAAAAVMAPGFLGLGLIQTISRKAVTQSLEEVTLGLAYYSRFIIALYVFIFIGMIAIGIVTDKVFLSVIVTIIVFLEHVNGDLYQLLLNLSRPFTANFLHFLRAALWAVIFMALSFFYPSLRTIELLLMGWAGGSVCALLVFAWFSRRWPWKSKPRILPLHKWIREEFSQARILYMTGFANTGSQYLDRYVVTFFLGLDLTGVYVFFKQVSSALSNLLYTGVIQIARPKMVKAHKEGLSTYASIYRSCLKHSVLASIAMGLVAGFCMDALMPYIDKPLATKWFPILWIILIGFVLNIAAQVRNLVFYSRHKDSLSLKVYLGVFVGSALFNMILIPFLGLWGAGLSLVLVALLRLTLQHLYIKPLIETGKTQKKKSYSHLN